MFKSISTFLPAGPVAALVLLCGAAASSGPFGAAPALAASAPVVSNVTAAQRDSTFLVDIGYDVADADGDPLFITILFSPDGGATWPVICRSVSGDAGAGVLPGDGKSVVWDARADYPGMILGAGIVRVTANDELPIPRLARLFRSALDGSGERALAPGDTIGFGEPVHIGWEFAAPSLAGLDPAWIAAQDSVAPFDDGILGAKWFSSLDGCIPALPPISSATTSACSTRRRATATRTSRRSGASTCGTTARERTCPEPCSLRGRCSCT